MSLQINLDSFKLDVDEGDEGFEIRESAGKDIAIIGMAAQMPIASSVEEFWDNIKNGIDCVREFPQERRGDADRYYRYKNPLDLPKRYLQSAYVDDIDKFDYDFFRLTPQEANLMSPVHRMVLQTAWSAVENAGYGGNKLNGSRTGVYLGFIGDLEGYKYKEIIEAVDSELLPVSVAGNLASMIPGRIAYVMNLKGPSVVVDTACSSSLVAIDHACRAMQTGSCDMAIAGGVRLTILPLDQENHRIGIESNDAATRTFDDRASGSGLGEGMGIVVLKPLQAALRDRDAIYAVIKGSAVNQDGTSMGITAPNPVSQENVIVQAWENAGVAPESISYIEVHGTGTYLGDTIEIDGLCGAFRRYTDKSQFCAISSVKTNIGHLYESAGIAGLIKAVMALNAKQIPPSLYLNLPNKNIAFTSAPVYINTKLRAWEAGEGPRRCGVSSFGISGTNCHLVLEEAPEPEAAITTGRPRILPLSARSVEALEELVRQYEQYLRQGDCALDDLCYTASTGRSHHSYRLALIAEDAEGLRDQLAALKGNVAQAAHYGMHKLILTEREETRPGEITEAARDELSAAAKRVSNEVNWAGNDDPQLLENLCALYVQGAELEWESLYRGANPQRLHLPTYPFARTRCWVPIPEEREETAVQTPDNFYYAVSWKPEALPVNTDAASGPVLIFQDAQGLGQELAARYRDQGRIVAEVEHGAGYADHGDGRFTVGDAEADYAALAAALTDVKFGKVIHLFSQHGAAVNSLAALEAAQARGVYSLFYLTRALGDPDREIDVVLAARTVRSVTQAETALHPEHATLFGMGKVVRREHPNLLCRTIDFDEHTSCQALFAELEAKTDVYGVAYRGDARFVEEFGEADIELADEQPLEIKENGVYLITGGTGGIGLETARYFAGQNRVNLVLLNRSQLPSRDEWDDILNAGEDVRAMQRIQDILALEELGATVALYAVDVLDREQLQTALADVRSRFGKIDGIVHGAGVGGAEMIAARKPADFHAVFAPKVQGTWNLDELTAADELDFMIVYSSIATMFSGAGQGDYTAANAYLDAFAEARSKRGKRTLAINWSTWKETGMAARSGFAADTLFKAITKEQAMHGFATVLNRAVHGVLIGELNYAWERIGLIESYQYRLSAQIRRTLERTTVKSPAKKVSKPAGGPVKLVGRGEESYSEIEQKIAVICQETLGFQEINIYDSFFELGADSLLLKKMHARLEIEYPGQVAVADIFEHSTILKLANYIAAQNSASEPPAMLPEKEKKPDVELDQGVHDLLGEMEKGNLSIDELVESLSKL
ncbi:hypothetical protein CBW65_03635 [Tumebacillus avium]|uniref:Uncharacterized protein n=1 Tax=Tumebacillus avium TaxID=1903704 RepID=A0A1Y0ILR0_9BACL|nr:SDR family NAD(P)-dependent oxidoreductase [Tumebacillus avium]ARU60254.1 hypothetical protein CBW65_03635 [Tumebacillus avium]